MDCPQAKGRYYRMDIEKILQQMTLEEKADFCSGSDFWHTQPVERLGVPAVMMSDGPSGLRKQDKQGDHLGINKSIPAVCFPSSRDGCFQLRYSSGRKAR